MMKEERHERREQEVPIDEVKVEQTVNDQQFLVPSDMYLKSGIHIGTKFKTKYMEQFIYKTRTDGLSVLNLQKIDERLRVLSKFLAQYEPKDILVVSRRENGWKCVKMFGKLTGVQTFAGRYPPGILTNPNLKTYIEAKVMLVTDVWPDRNAVNDALKVGIPVIALCDTNNQSNNIDLVIPCNNKGKKSIGLVFFILAKEYLKSKGLLDAEKEASIKLEDFVDE
ncbi:MAG: 30S ribosomal protein S2 [Candidatus Woesearchaeota archaeon]